MAYGHPSSLVFPAIPRLTLEPANLSAGMPWMGEPCPHRDTKLHESPGTQTKNTSRAAGIRRGARNRERILAAQAGYAVRNSETACRERRADFRRRCARGAV